MSNDTITYVIAGTAAGVSVIAWAALVLVPAWGSFSRVWERIVATVLSLYILAAFALAGSALGAAILWYYDESRAGRTRRRVSTCRRARPKRMSQPARQVAAAPDLGSLEAITQAVEGGLGLPEVVRAAARALDASLILIDRSSGVLAVAARSSADERSLMADAAGVETHELRVGDDVRRPPAPARPAPARSRRQRSCASSPR